MNRPRLHLAALLPLALPLLPSFACAQDNSPEQTIRVTVDRVNVGVIVTDARGRFVQGLRRENFHVFDNGAEQPITGFAPVEEPAQVLLLIEAGPAVYLLETGHLWAAQALLDGLSPGDRVAVVKYAEAPQAILDFTTDKQAAAAAFGQLRFNLGFGSLNLSSSLAKVLDWLTNITGKKTIVLLSTGLDTSSQNEALALLQRLRISDARVLAVSLTGGLQSPQPSGKKKSSPANSPDTSRQFEVAAQFMRQIASATGGRAYSPDTAKDFDAVYAQIAQLVRHEYSLAFAPPARDGAVHSIEVRVAAPQNSAPSTSVVPYHVDHRQAYLAPAPK